MSLLHIQFSDQEENLVIKYAATNDISVSELLRQSVLEKIEDEIGLELYEQAMAEHNEENKAVSFGKMSEELGM